MKTKLAFATIAALITLCLVIILAVSVEKKQKPSLAALEQEQKVETDSGLAAENNALIEDQAEQVIPLEPEPVETLTVSFAHVRSLTFWDERIAAGTENGVFTYKSEDSSYQFFYAANGLPDKNINDVLEYGDKLVIGSDEGLAMLDKAGNVSRIDFGFRPPVTALAEDNGTILIGTEDDGLIAYFDGSSQKMFDLPAISAVISSGDQIWVSSFGYGLYSFDGMEWKKRFLVNDTTAFDIITDLGTKFNRVYAGTPYGMYVFDGGQWRLYNEEDGLFACNISEIDFKGWKILVGTVDWGIYEVFEDLVTPRAWSEGMEVSALASNGEITVVGTPGDGIFIDDGTNIAHINPSPQTLTRPVMATIP